LDRDIGAADTALHERPEILKSVGVHIAVHISHGVIYNLTRVVSLQAVVRKQRIGIKRRASFHMLSHFGLKCAFLAIRNYGSANLAAALDDTHYCGFVFSACASDAALAFG